MPERPCHQHRQRCLSQRGTESVLTSDPDEFRAGLEGIYGDMWCLDSTKADVWQLQRCRIGAISLQRGVVPGGNVVVGEPRAELKLLYFFESKQAGSRFNGQAIEGHSAICFQPGQEFFLSHDHPHRWISLAIDGSDESQTESCVIDGRRHGPLHGPRPMAPSALIRCQNS